MEQNPTPDPVLSAHAAGDLHAIAIDPKRWPHTRLSLLMAAHGLNDDATAALLQIARPTVTRTRLGDRPASFDTAARIEALFGIPAVHWLTVPAIVHQHAKALRAAADERAGLAAPHARKAPKPRKAA